jgi:GT2 family glycosyltransferase
MASGSRTVGVGQAGCSPRTVHGAPADIQNVESHPLASYRMSSPNVSVIVPTFQRASTLETTLAALCALDYPEERLEILVIDDGSTDATPATVASFRPVRYFRQANSGVAAARNRGASLARGEILVFVDDDIVVSPDNVRRHLATRSEYGDCIVSGDASFAVDLRSLLESSPFGRFRLWVEDFSKTHHAVSWGSQGRIHPLTVPTGNISIPRDVFSSLGGFDERFPVGAEDQDLCLRARAAGCAIVHDYDIRVVHNDQHRDLLALCRREERGAIGLVCLARKHPDIPAPPSLALNGPLQATDSPGVVTRKLVRAALSRPRSLWLGYRIVKAVERVRPEGGWPLDLLYRGLTGLYVFRGVRRGFQVTDGTGWKQAHRAT